MSKISEYRALEAQIAEQLAQLDALKNNNELKREIEFEQKLRALLADYGLSLRNVIAILDPKASSGTAPAVGRPQRRKRALKIYLNPHTNERIETKGGNHKILKDWKEKYGAQTVESWLQ